MKPGYGQGASLGDAIAEHNRTILELMGKIPPRPIDYYPVPQVVAPTMPGIAQTIRGAQKVAKGVKQGVRLAQGVGKVAGKIAQFTPQYQVGQAIRRRLAKRKPPVAQAPEQE